MPSTRMAPATKKFAANEPVLSKMNPAAIGATIVVGQYQAASQQRLVLAASEEALFAAYDAFWIEQVLHNLVGNALK